jgi:ABC-type multidrug transport system fused ATPase/permease subunit
MLNSPRRIAAAALIVALFVATLLALAWLPARSWMLWLILVLLVPIAASARKWIERGPENARSTELEERKRYALALHDWLELEGERSESLDHLWADFEFLVGKLEFAEVTLENKAGQQRWQSASCKIVSAQPLRARYALKENDQISLEFVASRTVMDADEFELLSRIAARAWVRAVRFWCRTHRWRNRSDETHLP